MRNAKVRNYLKSWSYCELVRNIPLGILIGHIFEAQDNERQKFKAFSGFFLTA